MMTWDTLVEREKYRRCCWPECCSSQAINRRAIQWRHNGRDGVSNYKPHDCLLNRLFRCKSTKTSKLRVTVLCEGNSPVPDEFPTQRASDAENVSIRWRHHGYRLSAMRIFLWVNIIDLYLSIYDHKPYIVMYGGHCNWSFYGLDGRHWTIKRLR